MNGIISSSVSVLKYFPLRPTIGQACQYWPIGLWALGSVIVGAAISYLDFLSVIVVSACFLICFALIRWRAGAALSILLVTAFLDRTKLELSGGITLLPSHIGIIVVFLAVALWKFPAHRTRRLEAPEFILLGYIALNVISSILNAPEPVWAVRSAISYSLMILGYFLILQLVTTRHTAWLALSVLFVIGVFEAVLGIVAYTLNHTIGVVWGVNADYYAAGLSAVYGTLYEPNLFGSYEASIALGLLVAIQQGVLARWRLLGYIGLMAASAAVLISLSRTAVIVLLLGTALCLFLNSRSSLRNGLVLPIAVLSATLSVIALWYGGHVSVLKDITLIQRLFDLVQSPQFVDAERFNSYSNALNATGRSPVIGWGTKSYEQLFTWLSVSASGWLGNIVLRVLMDTGVIGLILFGSVLIRIVWKAVPYLSFQANGQGIVAVPFIMLVSLITSFLTTDGSTLVYFWLILGLLRSMSLAVDNPSHSKMEKNYAYRI